MFFRGALPRPSSWLSLSLYAGWYPTPETFILIFSVRGPELIHMTCSAYSTSVSCGDLFIPSPVSTITAASTQALVLWAQAELYCLHSYEPHIVHLPVNNSFTSCRLTRLSPQTSKKCKGYCILCVLVQLIFCSRAAPQVRPMMYLILEPSYLCLIDFGGDLELVPVWRIGSSVL